jgi:hypothetical protein
VDTPVAQPLATRNAARNDIKVRVVVDVGVFSTHVGVSDTHVGVSVWQVETAAAQPLATRNAARTDIKVRVVADVDGDQMEDVALIAVRRPLHLLSHRKYALISFRKSTPPQNRQLII